MWSNKRDKDPGVDRTLYYEVVDQRNKFAAEVERLKKEVAEVRMNWTADRLEMEPTIRSQSLEISRLKAELDEVRSERQEWYQKYRSAPTEDQLLKAIEERDQLRAEVERLRKAISFRVSHIEELQRELEDYASAAQAEATQVDILTKERDQLRGEVERLKAELEQAKKQAEVWRDGENALYNECKRLEKELELARGEIEDGNWIDCHNCFGGYSHHDCGEDTCCCVDPEDNVLCDVCDGYGGWYEQST